MLAAATSGPVPVETGFFFSLQGAATKQVTTVKNSLAGGLAFMCRRGCCRPYTTPRGELAVQTCSTSSSGVSLDKVVPTLLVVRYVKLKEAASFGQPIVEYAADSIGRHRLHQARRTGIASTGADRRPGRFGLTPEHRGTELRSA